MQRREFIACAGGVPAVLADPPRPGAGKKPDLPTTSPADLDRAVRGVVAGRRVGQVVFVRLTLHGPAKSAALAPWLARLTQLAAGWVGQAPLSVYAAGSAASGQATLTVRFAGGASALLTLARGEGRGDGI